MEEYVADKSFFSENFQHSLQAHGTLNLSVKLCGPTLFIFTFCVSYSVFCPIWNCHRWFPSPIAMAVAEGAIGHMPIL